MATKYRSCRQILNSLPRLTAVPLPVWRIATSPGSVFSSIPKSHTPCRVRRSLPTSCSIFVAARHCGRPQILSRTPSLGCASRSGKTRCYWACRVESIPQWWRPYSTAPSVTSSPVCSWITASCGSTRAIRSWPCLLRTWV